MNLTEWKEEVLRPRLLLTRLCRDRARVTDEDLHKAFEAAYGEKVECRIILYPANEQGYKQALAEYGEVRSGEEAFERKAKAQYKSEYASCAGKVRPFGRFEMEDPELDRVAFRLRPGEISEVVLTRQGPAVLLCLSRRPADATVSLESVRDRLVKDLLEKKTSEEMNNLVPRLREQANPRVLLTRPRSSSPPVMPEGSGEPRPNQVVAVYNGNVTITREELGEYLIACFGTETLEFLVNRRIIDKECAERGINVNPQEIDASLEGDFHKLHVTAEVFVKEFLGNYKKNLYEYREDAVRPRLLLEKLSAGRVRVTEEDLKKAFEAYHGEKLECRMILWPLDQTKFALAEYPKIRDSEKAFADKAKSQASPTLAAQGGKMPVFGHCTLDDPNLEAEAFKLQPGEVSTLIGTPQGNAVLKCDRRIPPDKGVTLEQERPRLEKEVRERKGQLEMQVVFNELAAKAKPQLLLKDAAKPADLRAELSRSLSDLPEAAREQLGLRGRLDSALPPPVP
jgi:parvulin-like peptidyl-prolyl isomerase